MSKFTVWVCEATGRGTTHVSSHEATTAPLAAVQAVEETLADWDWPEADKDKLHILGIASGNVTLIEWNDMGEIY
jgi:hypothetical protein